MYFTGGLQYNFYGGDKGQQKKDKRQQKKDKRQKTKDKIYPELVVCSEPAEVKETVISLGYFRLVLFQNRSILFAELW